MFLQHCPYVFSFSIKFDHLKGNKEVVPWQYLLSLSSWRETIVGNFFPLNFKTKWEYFSFHFTFLQPTSGQWILHGSPPFPGQRGFRNCHGEKWFEERQGSWLLSDPDISKALLGHQNGLPSTQRTGPVPGLWALWLSAGLGKANANAQTWILTSRAMQSRGRKWPSQYSKCIIWRSHEVLGVKTWDLQLHCVLRPHLNLVSNEDSWAAGPQSPRAVRTFGLSVVHGSQPPGILMCSWPSNVWRYWLGHHWEGRLLAPRGQRPGVLRNALWCADSPTTENDLAPDVQLLRPKGGGHEGWGHRDSHSQGQGEKQEPWTLTSNHRNASSNHKTRFFILEFAKLSRLVSNLGQAHTESAFTALRKEAST